MLETLIRKTLNRLINVYERKILLHKNVDNVFVGEDVFINTHYGLALKKNEEISRYLKTFIDSGAYLTLLQGVGLNSPIFVRGTGRCLIGKYSTLGKEIKIITSNHSMDYVNIQISLQNELGFTSVSGKAGEVNIGHSSWVGDRVIFLPDSSVGNGSVVGAGSIVTKKFPPYQIIAGNPAKIIRPRFSQRIIEELLTIQWWDWTKEKMLRNKAFFETDLNCNSESIDLESIIVN